MAETKRMNQAADMLRAENAALKTELKTLRRESEKLKAKAFELEDLRRQVFGLKNADIRPPSWTIRPWSYTKKDPVIPLLCLSDVHYGEVVDPRQVNQANEYNVKIADERLRLWTEKPIHLLKTHLGATYPQGIVVALGGDMVSGEIHEELTRTNEAAPPQLLLPFAGKLVWSILKLADAFERVHVVCVAGNHGRLDDKPQAKGGALRNWDTLLYDLLRDKLRGDDRVTWNVARGLETTFEVFSTKFLFTHGDRFKGGSGIQGALAPLMIADYRKRKQQRTMGSDYDFLLVGHFHQMMNLGPVIGNGAVKGFDEYAMSKGFPCEPPQQQFICVRPDGRFAYSMPLFLDK